MDRLTANRVNGIKTGYWSPCTKEVLVQRLALYEDAEEQGRLIFLPQDSPVRKKAEDGA